MSFLENSLTTDVYDPAANEGQTEPITYWPDIYADAIGSADQWNSKESCASFNQSQFRMIAENWDDHGNVAYYVV